MRIYSPDFIPVTQMALYIKDSPQKIITDCIALALFGKSHSVCFYSQGCCFFHYPAGKAFHNPHSQHLSFCQGTLIAPLRPKHEGVQTKDDECTLI